MQNPNKKDDTQPEFDKALRQLEVQLSLEDVDDYIYLEENLPASAPMNANFDNFSDDSVEILGTYILLLDIAKWMSFHYQTPRISMFSQFGPSEKGAFF